MKKWITLLTSILLFTHVFAQAQTITGVVTDASDGSTIPGVNILVKGTSNGTITQFDGTYSITVEGQAETLVFSYMGYETQEVAIGEQTEINVNLAPESKGLDEVVVIGYGTQKKSLVTGSISKVEVDDLSKNQARIEQSIQGKTAGVNIMQESGSPGAGLTIRIRGTGSNRNANPLFIVDGMRTGGMEYLNPNDIESIEVLKDAASAAIYGAEGANGVVLITTKSADKGESKVNYNYSYGWQEAVNTIPMMNGTQYADYFRSGFRQELLAAFPPDVEVPEEYLNNLLDNSVPFNPDTIGEGTNWQNEIFQTAPIQQHNVSIQGGTEKTNVFASASYFDQDGIVAGSKANFNRITARLNVDHDVKDWLKVGSKISYSHMNRKDISENNEFGGVISNAMALDPLTPVYVETIDDLPDKYLAQIYDNFDNFENSSLRAPGDKGYFGMSPYVQNEIANPLAQINNDHGRWMQDKLMAGFYADAELFDGFKIRSTFDIDMAYGTYSYWTPKFYYHSINYNFRTNTGENIDRWFTWQSENVANYSKQFGKHSIDVLAGNTVRDYQHRYLGGRGEVLVEESWDFAVLDAVLSDSTKAAASGSHDQTRLLSYFGRAQYDYDDKYMLNVTVRSDGSSKLAPGNKFRYFPSASVGWVISNESFWTPAAINFLKLRGSWGRNGSIGSLGNFEYVSTIISNAESSYFLSGGDKLTGSEPGQLANPDLVWETSEQINVGLDLHLFRSQVTLSADYFEKTTIDLITTGPVPLYVGNDQPSVNAGDIVNKGVELELGLKKRIGDFSYDITAVASYLKNEVTYIGNQASVLTGANLGTAGAITRAEEGKPVWFFYGYSADGVFANQDEIDAYTNAQGGLIQPKAIPGDVKFKDINQDGKITESDKVMIGSPHPDWTFSLSANFNYKGFDLGLFFNGRTGADVYFGAYRTDLTRNNKPEFFYTDAWTPDNTSADFPRYTNNDANRNFSHNSLFVFDGSFIRLQNAELGYTLPSALLDRASIDRLRVFVSGQNLFLMTDYPGDPELGNIGGYNGNSIGVDRGLYPRARVLTVGANLTF